MAQQAPSCRCVHSKCLKLYCVCFTRGVKFGFILCLLFFFLGPFGAKYPCFLFQEMCTDTCKCRSCRNSHAAVDVRKLAVKNLLKKKPDCFQPKVRTFFFLVLCNKKKWRFCSAFFIHLFFFGGVTDFSRSVQLRPISMYEEILPVLQCERTMYRCVPLLSLPKSLKKK